MSVLSIRRYQESDAAGFRALIEAENQRKGESTDPVELFERLLNDPTLIGWAILEDGLFAGHVGLVWRTGQVEPELNYVVSKAYRGRGLATAAVKLFVDEVRDELGLDRLLATVDVDNPASARVLEKAGFNFERQEVDEEGPYWVYFRRF